MGDEGKSRSARRKLFPSSSDTPTPTPTPRSSPPPTLVMLPHSQSASDLLSSPQQLINKSPTKKMDEGETALQPRAGDPPLGIPNSFDAEQQQEEEEGEKEKAGAEDGVQEEQEKDLPNCGVEVEEEGEKALASDGVQEEEEDVAAGGKTDLPASGPEPTRGDVAAGDKKRGKGSAFRVWSADDEVRILERLAAFVKTHGVPPARAELHGVVHGHLLHKKEFTLTEIYEKVRRLRDRYYTMQTKAAAAGAPPPTRDADEEELRKYELSAQIWGASLPLPKREPKENAAPSRQSRVRREFKELQDMYPHLTMLVEEVAAGDRGFLKRAFQLIDDGKARQFEAKVKRQRISEMKMQRDRSSAQREVLSTLMEYMA